MAVFFVMGCWHGLAWNYIIYDLLQGAGVAAVHYYTIYLKKRLGRAGYTRYLANPWIRWSGVAITFSYSAATLFFFANSMDNMARILAVFR